MLALRRGLTPKLAERVFGKAPSTDVNPDEAVALGAAIHADELARQSGAALLLDVVGNSLGVGVMGSCRTRTASWARWCCATSRAPRARTRRWR